jgi:phasin family protein
METGFRDGRRGSSTPYPPPSQNPYGARFMDATTEAAKTAHDYFYAGNAAFKDSIEKSIAALYELNTHSKKNFEAVIASMTAATKGAETVGARAIAFSKKSVEDQLAAGKAIANAKSVQEVVELQTNYAKTALEAMVAEVNEIAGAVSGSVKDAMSPINERVTAMVERVQTVR